MKHKGKSDPCKARLHLSMDYKTIISEDLAGPKSHCHISNPGKCEAKYNLWRRKSRAKKLELESEKIKAQQLPNIPTSSQVLNVI